MDKLSGNAVDNLFVVESPLQALVAVELSLKFRSEKNAIVYRLSDNRERNNEQIEKVIKNGNWVLVKKVLFKSTYGFGFHFSIRKALSNIRKSFSGNVDQLFIGEFRSQWMHFMRSAILPRQTILIDDGTATLASKRKFIDKGIFFPSSLWEGKNSFKELIKKNIYRSFSNREQLEAPVYIASAFLKDESVYSVDFSEIKQLFSNKNVSNGKKQVFFFGSKYSEAKIISLEYELLFIRSVKEFYSSSEVVYCAHRDESASKLNLIKKELGLEVLTPEMPAEIFLLQKSASVIEVSGAYSSILNNIKGLLPGVKIRAFRLKPEEININNRDDIEKIYDHFKKEGVHIELDEKHVCQ